MDQTLLDKLERLLAPISAERPAGEDLAYSPAYEEIQEARRADDPALAQGDWVTSVKSAEWGKVCALCEDILRRRSKDLQVAVWYAEALTRQEGYAGAAFAFTLLSGLLERYWESFHPLPDPGGPDERTARLEWLNVQLGQALRLVRITAPQQGGYDWYRWQESRDVENLGLRDAQARQQAIAEGKLPGDAFDKSARDSGIMWFQKLAEDLALAQAAYGELDRAVAGRFGDDAPSLAGLRDALDACGDVVHRLFAQYGGGPVFTETASSRSGSTEARSPGEAAPIQSSAPARTPVAARAAAIHKLREAAYYFRTCEPHSPVALLVERAARWAEMPLETWLHTVIKDESVLAQLRELLDIKSQEVITNV